MSRELSLDHTNLDADQRQFLLDNVLTGIDNYFNGVGNDRLRQLVLPAPMGSGKTYTTVNHLIPEFISRNISTGRNVIFFMAPLKEVVDDEYDNAREIMHDKRIGGEVVYVHNSDDLKAIIKGKKSLFSGFNVFFITCQFFGEHCGKVGFPTPSLVLADEGHLMFGCPDTTTTKQDKGFHSSKFIPKTLNKLNVFSNSGTTCVVFLGGTPTVSQQGGTKKGKIQYNPLPGMPKSKFTSTFLKWIEYSDSQDAIEASLLDFVETCDKLRSLIGQITPSTRGVIGDVVNRLSVMPAIMVKMGRANAKNGVPFEEYLDSLTQFADDNDIPLFYSTSDQKNFDGQKISALVDGLKKARDSQYLTRPLIMAVIDSGQAGINLVRMNHVAFGRDPQTPIHNNYSQVAGRGMRMKCGFRHHDHAIATIRSAAISQEQKKILAEIYVLQATTTVSVPESEILGKPVREFLHEDVFTDDEGYKYVMAGIFGIDANPSLLQSSIIHDGSYKILKKSYCEKCEVEINGHTVCYNSMFKRMESELSRQNIYLTPKDKRDLWFKCLQIDHINGDHFDHSPENLMTVCPNAHALKTIYKLDYANRYESLRREFA